MTVGTVITVALAVAAAIGLFLLVLARDIVSDLAKQEVRGWLPHLSRKIVRQAVESLPADQRSLLEDMEARLNELADRPLSMLWFALGVARDRRLIAREAHELALEPGGTAQVGRTASVRVSLLGAFEVIKRLLRAAYERVRQATRRISPWLVKVRAAATHTLTLLAPIAVGFMGFELQGSWPPRLLPGPINSVLVGELAIIFGVLSFKPARRWLVDLISRVFRR